MAVGGLVCDVGRQLYLRPTALLLPLRTRRRLVPEVQHHDLLTESHRLGVARVLRQQGRGEGATLPAAERCELLAVIFALRLSDRDGRVSGGPQRLVWGLAAAF